MYIKILIITFSTLFAFISNAQNTSDSLKIEYRQGCSFCASKVLASTLYTFKGGSYYTFKHDASAKVKNSEETVVIDTSTYFIFHDKQNDSIFELANMKKVSSEGVLIGEKCQTIDWTFTDSIRQINNHLCKLAFGVFRGRKYFVWYNPAIKTNKSGPWKLHGIPGAIIYAVDVRNEIYFQANKIERVNRKELEQSVIIPALPIVSRQSFREWRESVYTRIENIKPPEGSSVKYNIKVQRNNMELDELYSD